MLIRSKTSRIILVVASLGSMVALVAADAGKAAVVGDNLRVPEHYRTQYQFLGTWSIASPKAPGAKQLHNVYASPGATDAYLKTGHFPDDTVLVKEVFDGTTEKMSTGTVSREGNLKGWFVMVKDSKNSHPNSKLWGDGWGWSWFDAGSPTKTTSTEYKSDCIPCHVPAQSTDWIYTQGYPILKR